MFLYYIYDQMILPCVCLCFYKSGSEGWLYPTYDIDWPSTNLRYRCAEIANQDTENKRNIFALVYWTQFSVLHEYYASKPKAIPSTILPTLNVANSKFYIKIGYESIICTHRRPETSLNKMLQMLQLQGDHDQYCNFNLSSV